MNKQDAEMLKLIYDKEIERLKNETVKLKTTLVFLINELKILLGEKDSETYIKFLNEESK